MHEIELRPVRPTGLDVTRFLDPHVILAFFVGFSLISCGSLSKSREQNIALVKIGQTADEVESTIGEPKKKASSGAVETWYYNIYSSDSSRVYPYAAIFENKILKSFQADSFSQRDEDDRRLREKRGKSDQLLFVPGAPDTNGSPPLKP